MREGGTPRNYGNLSSIFMCEIFSRWYLTPKDCDIIHSRVGSSQGTIESIKINIL